MILDPSIILLMLTTENDLSVPIFIENVDCSGYENRLIAITRIYMTKVISGLTVTQLKF